LIDDPTIGAEYCFFYYDLSGPIISLEHVRLKKGVFVGNSHEELDIYCNRTIYRCLEDDLYASEEEALRAIRTYVSNI
jgi:hypothetical protein